MIRALVRLAKTLTGATGVIGGIALSAFIWKQLSVQTPAMVDYSNIATLIAMGGVILGLALFFADGKSDRTEGARSRSRRDHQN